MWPDRVSNPGPPTYESGALPIALRGPAVCLTYPLSKSYTTVCLPVCGDDPQALASGFSPAQAEESKV